MEPNEESFTQEIYSHTMSTVRHEAKAITKRVMKFLLKNIVLIILRIIECSWMITLALISLPLKWNLQLCQILLDFVIKGICCISCLACNCGRKRHQESEHERQAPPKVCRSKKRKVVKPRKLSVVLDIDQTLVFSTNDPGQHDKADFTVFDNIRGETLYVHKRPYLDYFLEELNKMQAEGLIEVSTYTAGTEDYAEQILARVDPEHQIEFRFNRNDCIMDSVNKTLLKDLTFIYQKIKEIKAAKKTKNGEPQDEDDSTEVEEMFGEEMKWMASSFLKHMIILDDSISTFRNFQSKLFITDHYFFQKTTPSTSRPGATTIRGTTC